MAYEREAIVPNSAAVQPTIAPQMKEERVFSPYHTSVKASPEVVNSEVPVEPKATTEASVTLSPAAAALARKEQKFRQQQLDLKNKEQALEAERKEIAELKNLKAKLAAKDYSGLEDQIPYNEYTEYLLSKQGNMTPEQQALKKLETELESVKKAQIDDVSKRFDAAVNERRQAVTKLVDSDQAYARIKKAGAQEAVVQHILDTWEHDEIDLTPEQAAKEVEELLKEKAQKWASLIEEPKSEATVEKQLPPLKPGIKTLTNNMAATGDLTRPKKSFQGMTDSERYAEARRRAEEKLKLQTKG